MGNPTSGRIRMLRRLGAGGMGEVFLAVLEGEGGFSRKLVIKRIQPALSNQEAFRDLFTAEARIAAALHHPHIVQVIDFDRSPEGCTLTMEFVDGADLTRLQAGARKQGRRIPLDFSLAMALACLRALGYAHRQVPAVIHGDVSPGNVLVGREGEIKLADFGLSRLGGPPSSTKAVAGNPGYMAPEVAAGVPPSPVSDLYGLAAVLWEMLAGAPLRPATADLEVALEQARKGSVPALAIQAPDLPPALHQVLDRALARNPRERFPDAPAMEECLLRIASTLGLETGPRVVGGLVQELMGPSEEDPARPVPQTVFAPSRPRSLRLLLAIGLPLLGAAGLFGWAWWQAGDSPSPGIPSASDSRPLEEPPAGASGPDAGSEPLAGADEHDTSPAPGDPRTATRPKPVAASDAGIPDEPGEPAPPPPQDAGVEVAAAPARALKVVTDRPTRCSFDRGAETACPLEGAAPLGAARLLRVVDVASGLQVSVRVEPEGPAGRFRLAFDTRPFAILRVDGQPRGLTPLANLRLTSGEHAIGLAASDRPPLEIQLTLP